MRMTKHGHACVRLSAEGRVLVVDPGAWSPDVPLDDADAVLVTHEHADHVDAARVARLGIPVFAPADARIPGLETIGVRAGEEFTAAGFRVRAVGGRHAEITDGEPDCANLGYVVDGDFYHPGDSLHVPEVAVRTLAIPAQASWFKMGEAISFARAVAPERSFAIHDGQVNERGLASVNGWLGENARGYRYLAPGETL
ncbi:MBL fold metallo-hydrolase [Mangrovihabitans endophyticus]|uniref:MBL fold metallo-hydrolase n=1 Tax=Mangrovihabitans endophyticus TaxID=1751298 RepID=UPI00166F59E2